MRNREETLKAVTVSKRMNTGENAMEEKTEEEENMSYVSMKQLLEAGVHFGHQTRRWNPKMKEYIYTQRNGIYIIDLQKTVTKIGEAYEFVRSVAEEGKQILFVGTKKQAQENIKKEALRCGELYVEHRWLGGTLTNYKTISKRVARLDELEKMESDGTFELLPKKEVINLLREKERLEKFLGGIREMKKMPGALFIIDPKKERIAVMEARKLDIPIVAVVDTNCDPDEIDYPIPGNDDAIRAVALISKIIANAVLEGKQGEQFTEEDSDVEAVAEAQEEVQEEVTSKAEEKAEVQAEPEEMVSEEVKEVAPKAEEAAEEVAEEQKETAATAQEAKETLDETEEK